MVPRDQLHRIPGQNDSSSSMSLNIFLSNIFRLVVKKASGFFSPCNASHIDFHHGLDLLPFLRRAGAHHLLLHDHLDLLVLFFLSFDDIVG